MTNKVYDIYAKGKCIYHHLPEKEFIQTWDMMSKFLQVTGALKKSDVRYEEIRIKM
jgi:hypothetical protein